MSEEVDTVRLLNTTLNATTANYFENASSEQSFLMPRKTQEIIG